MRHRASNEDFLFLQLKDENSKLRRKLTEVQSFSETQTEMYVSFELGLQFKLSSDPQRNQCENDNEVSELDCAWVFIVCFFVLFFKISLFI